MFGVSKSEFKFLLNKVSGILKCEIVDVMDDYLLVEKSFDPFSNKEYKYYYRVTEGWDKNGFGRKIKKELPEKEFEVLKKGLPVKGYET